MVSIMPSLLLSILYTCVIIVSDKFEEILDLSPDNSLLNKCESGVIIIIQEKNINTFCANERMREQHGL